MASGRGARPQGAQRLRRHDQERPRGSAAKQANRRRPCLTIGGEGFWQHANQPGCADRCVRARDRGPRGTHGGAKKGDRIEDEATGLTGETARRGPSLPRVVECGQAGGWWLLLSTGSVGRHWFGATLSAPAAKAGLRLPRGAARVPVTLSQPFRSRSPASTSREVADLQPVRALSTL